MPGDISKHTKYMDSKPYPEPKVECENVFYANLLLQDYAGMVSEFTAVSLYSFQHIVSDKEYKDYAELIGGISMVEMKHLELLGETIKLLGRKPAFISCSCNEWEYWKASNVDYADNILDMLRADIRAESEAIENYNKHLEMIGDKYIRKLLDRIIIDEKLHLKLFENMYNKYMMKEKKKEEEKNKASKSKKHKD